MGNHQHRRWWAAVVTALLQTIPVMAKLTKTFDKALIWALCLQVRPVHPVICQLFSIHWHLPNKSNHLFPHGWRDLVTSYIAISTETNSSCPGFFRGGGGLSNALSNLRMFSFPVSLPFPQALQEVTVPIVSNADCSSSYSGLTSNMLCAGQAGKDSCQVSGAAGPKCSAD